MKTYLRLIVILTLICLFWTALLAGVNVLTRDRIAASALAREIAAARDVLPAGTPAPELRGFGSVSNYVALAPDGRLLGAAVKGTSPNGYGGAITLMVGFTADGTLNNFAVLDARETPGLGSKIDSDAFKGRIRGRPAATRWQVTRDGGEIDAITAATISSRAALEAIRDAAASFASIRESLSGGATETP
ncbi:MAG: RnfABCDGE type electron transport complex subunit G [Lentisphaerae bacterium]|nr:RnfABCDGE type electron transport complex subunit G [Lentisphaerota bacterium]